MKMIAQTLGVSRSNLSQRMKESPKTSSHYQKASDIEVLPQIPRAAPPFLLQFVAHNLRGWLKRLLKHLSGIMSISTIIPTQKWSWRSSTVGLMTTTTAIPTRD